MAAGLLTLQSGYMADLTMRHMSSSLPSGPVKV